jgi:tetratricopeptide (TPR) repeat protein
MKARAAASLLVAAVVAAYSNSFHGPFVFDDVHSITQNPTIRRLASAGIWSPPHGVTVSGRPIVNVSLALNYAIGEETVRGYHAFNLGIHTLAALTLFGLLRRTFAQPRLQSQFDRGASATWVALSAALIWALHPLQTESVTYVVQRAESLMALFYLLTLYCFVRGLDANRDGRGDKAENRLLASAATHNLWFVLSFIACALGMATKEVMVSAPLIVLLYDRVFVGASLRDIWRDRRALHLALASTWLILAFLLWHAGDRAGTMGFSTGVKPWEYALTQCRAIMHYLRLAVWPNPLVFDYGEYRPSSVGDLAPYAILLAAFVTGVIFLGRRRPAVGFAAAAFFLVLVPTSSVVPILTEPIAEHRMYLPLAAVCALAAAGLNAATSRWSIALTTAATLGGGFLTFQRNETYRTERALWAATVHAAPQNPRAHGSLARVLVASGELEAAETHFAKALALRPDYVDARHGLGDLLLDQGRRTEAVAHYQAILRDHPNDFVAHHALGQLNFQLGDLRAAARHFENALRINPASAPAHNNLGCVLFELGDLPAAKTHEETALRLKPDYAEANYNLGNVQARQGHLREARTCYERALELAPDYPEAHINLAAVLQSLGERAAAIVHYREALRLRPDSAFAQKNLSTLLGAPESR